MNEILSLNNLICINLNELTTKSHNNHYWKSIEGWIWSNKIKVEDSTTVWPSFNVMSFKQVKMGLSIVLWPLRVCINM